MAGEYFDASVRTRLETGFIQTLGRALDSIDRARAAGHTCNCLANMSDAELASRGIQREDIPKIVIEQLLGPIPTHSGH